MAVPRRRCSLPAAGGASGWAPAPLAVRRLGGAWLLAWLAAALPIARGASVLGSVVHMPTIGDTGNMVPPEVPRIEPLHEDGPQIDTATKEVSKFLYVGCFQAGLEITIDTEITSAYDPNLCVDKCREIFPNEPLQDMVVAVHDSRCGCNTLSANWLQNAHVMGFFSEVNDTLCDIPCALFDNPLCGGLGENGEYYWGVFKQFDYHSMSTTGAYDPGRYIWFTVVVLMEKTITGSTPPEGETPERYYLHATYTQLGDAAFPFHARLPGLVQGLQYDLDSTRVVGILTSSSTGRVTSRSWQYYLFVITIDMENETFPQLSWPTNPPSIFPQQTISYQFMAYGAVSGICSKNGVDLYLMPMLEERYESDGASVALRNSKTRLYYIDVPEGTVRESQSLSFVALELICNEKFGDVTALGHQLGIGAGTPRGVMRMVNIGKAYFSDAEARKVVELYSNQVYQWDALAVHPGVCASDHLFNKTLIAYRDYDADWTHTRLPELSALTIMEVNIRQESQPVNWCAPDDCLGTVDYRAPMAGIFNKEPRIPLSLAAPSLESARFDIDAAKITITFDRATLQGAVPMDEDNDVVPDYVDYSTQLSGVWDCNAVFDDSTVELLGKYPPDGETTCTWLDQRTVKVTLGPPSTWGAQVGDSIFLDADTIYTVPNVELSEYSMAGSGGIQLSLPEPLLDPAINFNGALQVDECTDAHFDVSDSAFMGPKGYGTYKWELINYTDTIFKTTGPRLYNATLLPLLEQTFVNATADNTGVLHIPTEYMMPAFSFHIKLTATSWWGVSVAYHVDLLSLDYQSPVVTILGPVSRTFNRTQSFSLIAAGSPSECTTGDRGLTYSWTDLTGQIDLVAEGVNTGSKTLGIPAYTLHPYNDDTNTDNMNMYNFSVSVIVTASPGGAVASAFVAVYIQRSPVYVVLAKEDHVLTLGNELVVDARASLDPDYPTSVGTTFRGTFAYWCVKPDLSPCFGNNPEGYIGDSSSLPQCETDISQVLNVGGSAFSKPLWEAMTTPYCKWARGVLMIDSLNLTAGDYDFTVQCIAYDGRTDAKSFTVTLTPLDVPSVLLSITDPEGATKYPVTQTIRMEGKVENGLDPTANVQFYWTLYEYTNNPEYDVDLAEEAATNEAITYTVPANVFLDKSAEYQLDNDTRFIWSPLSTDMRILPNALLPSKTYKFRLIVSVSNGAVEGFSDVTFSTAGLAPRNGNLVVSPDPARLDEQRVFTANGWVADDLPLSYQFGYLAFLDGNQVSVKLTSDTLPVSQTTVPEMVLGEPSTNYTLAVYVEVCTPFDACTSKFATIQSMLPDNVTAFTNSLLEEAITTDPETAVTNLMTAVSINTVEPAPAPGQPMEPEKEELLTEITETLIEVMQVAPVTPATQLNQAVVITQVIDAGLKDNTAMDALEALVNAGADADPPLYDINNPDLMSAAFSAISSILPEAPAESIELPTGQSVLNFEAAMAAATNGVVQNQQMYAKSNMATAGARQYANHPLDQSNTGVINACGSGYCDKVNLACVPAGVRMVYFTCCNSVNEATNCRDPPCWISGNKCPAPSTISSSSASERRLVPGGRKRRLPDYWSRKLSEEFTYSSIARPKSDLGAAPLGSGRGLTATEDKDPYANWSTDSLALLDMEEDERFILPYAKAAQYTRDQRVQQDVEIRARQEAYWAMMDQEQVGKGAALREEADARAEASAAAKYLKNRQHSSVITRAAVLRNTICKVAILQMGLTNEAPMYFGQSKFELWFGKTTNMSNVMVPQLVFQFPSKFSIPPAFATADNAFSFIYVEYSNNMYYWSDSTPPSSNRTRIVSLIVMQANTYEFQVENESEPIKMFSDEDQMSSSQCMFWDRFYPNTAGGAWSPVGLLNNGDGCLTTHLSDIAIFIDGRVPTVTKLASASSYYMDSTSQDMLELAQNQTENKIYVDVGTNLMQVALIGILILVWTLSLLWGYIMDELHREKQRTGKLPRATLRLAGDGVSEARTVDDPIAYGHATQQQLFLAVTFWNVLKRDHAVIAPIFFHPTFTRPQRLMCMGVMLTGVMALNAVVYGEPDELVSGDQYPAVGVLSGLIVFPVYCTVCFMFANRPTRLQRRLVKKHTPVESYEAMGKMRKELEHKSMLKPAADYVRLPALPQQTGQTGMQGLRDRGTALLTLPPAGLNALPGLSTLPRPSNLPVAGLPALPGAPGSSGGFGGIPGLPGLPGLGALPPLPPATNNPALAGLPPLPKYPAPAAFRGQQLQDALPPPSTPPQARGEPAAPAMRQLGPPGGEVAALDNRPAMVQGEAAPPAPPTTPPLDSERTPALPGSLEAEPSHGMAPPGQPPPPPGAPPTPGGSSTRSGIPPLPVASGLGGRGGMGFSSPREGADSPGRPESGAVTPPTGSYSNFVPKTPPGVPPSNLVAMGNTGMSVGGVTGGIVHRGEPPNMIPPPFAPGEGGRSAVGLGATGDLSMPTSSPPTMGASGGDFWSMPGVSNMGLSGVPAPPPPPPPPPPPREDDQTFVRRVRLTYLDRAHASHQRVLLEENQEVNWTTPAWVFQVTWLTPYLSCLVIMTGNVFFTIAYASKFRRIEETHWGYAGLIALGLWLVVLEVIRGAISTVVELRKFEIRRRMAGGDFLQSRLRQVGQGAKRPDVQLKGPPLRRPPVPLSAPKNPPKSKPPPPPRSALPSSRPTFLPPPPGGPLPSNAPMLRSGTGQSLPVAPPLPGLSNIRVSDSGTPIPGTPHSAGTNVSQVTPGGRGMPANNNRRGGGTPPVTPPLQSGGSLLPGRLDSSPFGPSAAPMPPPLPGGMPPSPEGSAVSAVSAALSEKLKASRVATPPPLPPGGASRPPSGGSAASGSRGPRPPATQASGFLRKSSSISGGSAPPRPPNTPPPSGTVQQTRASLRAQHQVSGDQGT